MGFFEKFNSVVNSAFPPEALDDPKLPEKTPEEKVVELLKRWNAGLSTESEKTGENREGIDNTLTQDPVQKPAGLIPQIDALMKTIPEDKHDALFTAAGLNPDDVLLFARTAWDELRKTSV